MSLAPCLSALPSVYHLLDEMGRWVDARGYENEGMEGEMVPGVHDDRRRRE